MPNHARPRYDQDVAYAAQLLSVPEAAVHAYQRGELPSLTPSKAVLCSHLLAYWVTVQPLGQYLQAALDGGEILREDLRHRFRLPTWWSAATVEELSRQLSTTWQEVLQTQTIPDPEDWYCVEITKVVELFAHARAQQEAVVKMLEGTVVRK